MREKTYRQNGISEEEYAQGQQCFSCSNCVGAKVGGRCMCRISHDRKYTYRPNKCAGYVDAKLIMCQECDTFFRSLSKHVIVHKLTIYQYKEKHGYNRGSSMTCKATMDLSSKNGKINMTLKGHEIHNGNKGRKNPMRAQGKMNLNAELEKRGGLDYMRSMVAEHISTAKRKREEG